MMKAAETGCTGCAKCGDEKPPVRAPRIAWALIPLAWTALLLVGACSALLLPLNLVFIPCWLACASAVGPMARKLLDPKCGACGEPRGSATRPANVTRRAARRAHEGAMESGLIGEAQ
jgi:hypothetical protein